MEEKEEIAAVNANDITWMKSILTDIKHQVTVTNGRVTALELWKANILGIVIGISTLASLLITAVLTLIKFVVGF